MKWHDVWKYFNDKVLFRPWDVLVACPSIDPQIKVDGIISRNVHFSGENPSPRFFNISISDTCFSGTVIACGKEAKGIFLNKDVIVPLDGIRFSFLLDRLGIEFVVANMKDIPMVFDALYFKEESSSFLIKERQRHRQDDDWV